MTNSLTLAFGKSWATHDRSEADVIARFQQHEHPVSDIWFKSRTQQSSVSAAIRIGSLSLVAACRNPVYVRTNPDDQLSLVFLTQGSAVATSSGTSVRWMAGQQCLRSSPEEALEVSCNDMSLVAIRPSFQDLTREIQKQGPSSVRANRQIPNSAAPLLPTTVGRTDYSATMFKLFKMVDNCGRDAAFLERIGIDGIITRVLAALILAQNGDTRSDDPPISASHARQAIDIVCDHVRQFIGTPLTIGDMEDLTGLSQRALNTVFQSRFNCSPLQWQRNFLLDEGEKRFSAAEQDVSVETVSYELGFSSASSFSSHYADRFGELPSQTLTRHRRH